MSGVSPVGVAVNGTRSGKRSCDLSFMRLVFPNLPSCLPSLATGLVPAGHHYYEGSDSPTERVKGLHAVGVSLLISTELLDIPSLETLLPFRSPRFRHRYDFSSPCEPPHDPCGRAATRSWATSWIGVRSEVRHSLEGSPTGLAKSSSLSLRTVRSLPVALHLFC